MAVTFILCSATLDVQPSFAHVHVLPASLESLSFPSLTMEVLKTLQGPTWMDHPPPGRLLFSPRQDEWGSLWNQQRPPHHSAAKHSGHLSYLPLQLDYELL